MEPDNIEKIIQDNFKKREIKPSSEARERLIVALNTPPKKKKKLWLRYAVAASLLLGLFLAGSQFVLKTEDTIEPLKVGYDNETSKETPVIKEDVVPQSNSSINNAIVLDTEIDSESIETKKDEQESVINTKVKTSKQQLALEVLPAKTKDDELPVKDSINQNLNENLIKTEPSEKLAINDSPTQFQYITAEQLLQITRIDSTIELRKNIKKESKTYLESDALLVEMEKNLFDEKNKSIFKRAGKQLKEFKEAVANRNYEPNH